MMIFLIYLISHFTAQYQDFINSSEGEEIFNGLVKGEYKISDFANDPVVLWFWRSNSTSPEADSFLKKIPFKRNFHLAAVLRWEAKESTDYEKQLSKLHLATHFDSSAVENFLSFISFALMHRDFKCVKTAFSLPVFLDFRNQIFMITNIGILLIVTLFMSSVVFVLVKIVYYLPALGHQIGFRKHNQIANLIKSLLLLIPILVLRNLYLIFTCYAILLILVLNSREKNWLRFYVIVLLLMFMLSLPINNCISFLKGHNRSYRLYEMVNYDTFLDLKPKNNKEKEFLAYALKQQERLEEALSLYENLYYHGYRSIAVVNNLANIYSYYNEYARAESLYSYAILSQNRGESYFNLGVLKLKSIEYSESSKYMEEARKRNFSSLLTEPVDIEPNNDDFYKIVFSQRLKFDGLIKNIFVIPIIIIFILTFLPYKLSPPFYCTICSSAICKDCLKELDNETICENCFTRFKSTKKAETEEELKRAMRKSRRRIKRLILFAINTIIPGAGLIYLGRHFTGMILVGLVTLGYAPLLFPQIFVKPLGWIALPFDSVFICTAILLAALSYIVSFSMLKGYHAD